MLECSLLPWLWGLLGLSSWVYNSAGAALISSPSPHLLAILEPLLWDLNLRSADLRWCSLRKSWGRSSILWSAPLKDALERLPNRSLSLPVGSKSLSSVMMCLCESYLKLLLPKALPPPPLESLCEKSPPLKPPRSGAPNRLSNPEKYGRSVSIIMEDLPLLL